jgi:hypothetical protein
MGRGWVLGFRETKKSESLWRNKGLIATVVLYCIQSLNDTAFTEVICWTMSQPLTTYHVWLDWIWGNQPIHSFLVGCLSPCLQGTSVRVGSPQPLDWSHMFPPYVCPILVPLALHSTYGVQRFLLQLTLWNVHIIPNCSHDPIIICTLTKLINMYPSNTLYVCIQGFV